MAHAPKEHERISDNEARAKLAENVDRFDSLQGKMKEKNPTTGKKEASEVPKNLVADLKRQRKALGQVHSPQEAFGHISEVVKELELAIVDKNTSKTRSILRRIACVALCSETWSKKTKE